MINNLSQVKKAIANGREFMIVEHFIKPHLTGQKRKPSKVQTNAFYSVVPDDPDNEVSKANGGLGYFLQYGKASDWDFNGELITVNCRGNKIMTIKFVEAE